MDIDRFDHLTRVVATRRRGLAALIGAVALVISSPAADAKRKKTRCEFETCRGVCCKNNETCYLGRCQRVQGWQEGDTCKAAGESCGGCCSYCNSYSACPQHNQCCSGTCNPNGTSWGRQLYACS